MTATTLTAPLLLTNDLLTGAEWSPAQVKQLLHLTADIKAHPARYATTLRGNMPTAWRTRAMTLPASSRAWAAPRRSTSST